LICIIFQRFPEEGENLIFVTLRPDEIGVIFDIIYQPVLIFAHPEKIIALFPILRCRLMIGAKPVFQFLLHVKALAADAVVTLVFSKIDVTVIIDLLQD
jgi:hypothetical protein